MPLKKIALFSPQPLSACPRIRVSGPAALVGIEVLFGDSSNYEQAISASDLVVIQRDFPKWNEIFEDIISISRKLGRKIVYEIDDLLLELPKSNPWASAGNRFRFDVLKAIMEVDAVIVSTDELYKQISDFHPHTFVFRNYLDDGIWSFPYPNQVLGKESGLSVGYMGTNTHAEDLELVAPVLKRLLSRGNIRFTSWGQELPENLKRQHNASYIESNIIPYKEFVAKFAQVKCDIFIAPLKDSLFNRCKSSIKFLEYAYMGIPGIFSDLPPYQSVVKNHANGILAATEDQWESAITDLLNSSAMRQLIAKEARITLEDHRLSKHSGEWLKLYETIFERASVKDIQTSLRDVILRMHSWNMELELDLRDKDSAFEALTNDPKLLAQHVGLKTLITALMSSTRTKKSLLALKQRTAGKPPDFMRIGN
jgi:glycosyltransferase involved in cell wall biosynthesis